MTELSDSALSSHHGLRVVMRNYSILPVSRSVSTQNWYFHSERCHNRSIFVRSSDYADPDVRSCPDPSALVRSCPSGVARMPRSGNFWEFQQKNPFRKHIFSAKRWLKCSKFSRCARHQPMVMTKWKFISSVYRGNYDKEFQWWLERHIFLSRLSRKEGGEYHWSGHNCYIIIGLLHGVRPCHPELPQQRRGLVAASGAPMESDWVTIRRQLNRREAAIFFSGYCVRSSASCP